MLESYRPNHLIFRRLLVRNEALRRKALDEITLELGNLIDSVQDMQDPESGTGPLYLIYTLAFLLPSIAVAIRRLHDTGRTGWWLLLALIPLIGAIVLIVFYCLDSQPGENEYGPNPKGVQN